MHRFSFFISNFLLLFSLSFFYGENVYSAGNPSPEELRALKEKATLPKDSQKSFYYYSIIKNDIDPFLKKYPNHSSTDEIKILKRKLSHEFTLVRENWVRKGDTWHSPNEAARSEKNENFLKLLVQLKNVQSEIDNENYSSLAKLSPLVESHKNQLYYPTLLEGLQVILTSVHEDHLPFELRHLISINPSDMRRQISQFKKAQATIEEYRAKNLTQLDLLKAPLRKLESMSLAWPDFQPLHELVSSHFNHIAFQLWQQNLTGHNQNARSLHNTQALLTNIVNKATLPLEEKSRYVQNLNQIRPYSKKIKTLKSKKEWKTLANVDPPSEASLELIRLIHTLHSEAEENIAEAQKLFENSKSAYQKKNLRETQEKLIQSRKLWPENPGGDDFLNQLLNDFSNLLKNKERDMALEILNILSTGWPRHQKVIAAESEAEQSISYSFFDDLSYSFSFVIAFSLLVAIIALKYVAKLFTD